MDVTGLEVTGLKILAFGNVRDDASYSVVRAFRYTNAAGEKRLLRLHARDHGHIHDAGIDLFTAVGGEIGRNDAGAVAAPHKRNLFRAGRGKYRVDIGVQIPRGLKRVHAPVITVVIVPFPEAGDLFRHGGRRPGPGGAVAVLRLAISVKGGGRPDRRERGDEHIRVFLPAVREHGLCEFLQQRLHRRAVPQERADIEIVRHDRFAGGIQNVRVAGAGHRDDRDILRPVLRKGRQQQREAETNGKNQRKRFFHSRSPSDVS